MKLYLDPNLVLQPEGKLDPGPGQLGDLARKRLEAKRWMIKNLDPQRHPLIHDYALEVDECALKT